MENVELTNLDPAALLISTENTLASNSLNSLPVNCSLICIDVHLCMTKQTKIDTQTNNADM